MLREYGEILVDLWEVVSYGVGVGGNGAADRAQKNVTTKGNSQMSTTMNKAYNATRNGQMAMAYDASSRAVAFMLNKAIKSKGGIGWQDDMIASANPILLSSIKENLIEEYNSLVSQKETKAAE